MRDSTSSGDGLLANRGRSLRIRSESVLPSSAARAFRARCRSSGTLWIWIIFMRRTGSHVMHMPSDNACSAAELGDHPVEHRQRWAPFDTVASRMKRLSVEQAELARASE